jgi:hypothetical protein
MRRGTLVLHFNIRVPKSSFMQHVAGDQHGYVMASKYLGIFRRKPLRMGLTERMCVGR